MRDFNFYGDVGAPGTNLGNFIEVGAGPWTQSLWMIQQRKFQVENYVIMEPGASSYMNTVETCVYRDGEVRGFEGRTLIINAGAERLDVFDQAFDTLMMINVIEHVENGIRILRNINNALKPGGLLIFNDRWWDSEGPPGKKRSLFDLDVLYHPVRMKQAVFDQFLSGFDKIYERRDQEAESFRRHKYTGTYFIGRKKAAPCT